MESNAMKKTKRDKMVAELKELGLKDDDFAHQSWCVSGLALCTEGSNSHLVGNYWMAGEDCHGGLYDDFGVNQEVNRIAKKYGCFTEWYNAAVLCIVEM